MLALFLLFVSTQASDFCQGGLDSSHRLTCQGFDSLDQLDFTWNAGVDHTFEELVLRPATPIRFDRSLRLNGLKLADRFQVTLVNFDGFEFHANPFRLNSPSQLTVVNSTLQFFYNDHLFSAASRSCQLYNTGLGASYVPLFSTFSRLTLDSVVVSSKQCEHIFQNAEIRELSLTDSNVAELQRDFFSPRLLKHLKHLKISGSGFDVVDQIADSLESLQILELDLNTFKQIKPRSLDRIGHPVFLLVDESSAKHGATPGEILCSLKHLEGQKSVIPIVASKQSPECDCTQMWLLKNFYSNLSLSSTEVEPWPWSSCQSLSPQDYAAKTQACSLVQCDPTRAEPRDSSALKDSADSNSKRQNVNFIVFAVLVFVALAIVLLIRWYTFERLKQDFVNAFYRITGRPRPDVHTEMTLTSFANPMASGYPHSRTEEFSMGNMSAAAAARVSVVDESNE